LFAEVALPEMSCLLKNNWLGWFT